MQVQYKHIWAQLGHSYKALCYDNYSSKVNI